MPAQRKIAFLLEDFSRPSPAQQLLDRFLAGFPRDGQWHKPQYDKKSAYLMLGHSEGGLDSRARDFGLEGSLTAEEAVAGADCVVVVSRKPGALSNERFVRIALEGAAPGSACFVHGALANSLTAGQQLATLSHTRQAKLLSGTPLCVTWRLPHFELPKQQPITEALIVVQVSAQAIQASPPAPPASLRGAELHGLEGLLPVVEGRKGGETGVRRVRFLEGREFWRAGDRGLWSWDLLSAALARSDTPQGDALLDARTQDLVKLGLVQKLARNPRGWLLEHRDGLRSAILVLDGVVADFNFAVRGNEVLSAQLLRAPAPAERHFDLLAATVEHFFQTGDQPWPLERSLLIAGLLEAFAKPATRSGKWVELHGLDSGYRV